MFDYERLSELCKVNRIDYYRVLYLLDELDIQINEEIYPEMEKMRNINSKFSTRKELKHLISDNENKEQ